MKGKMSKNPKKMGKKMSMKGKGMAKKVSAKTAKGGY